MTAPAIATPTATPVLSPATPASPEPTGLNAMISKIASNTSVPEHLRDEPSAPPQAPESVTQVAEAVDSVPRETEQASAPAGPQGEIAIDDGDITLRAERNPDGTFKTQIDPGQKFDIQMRDPETGEMRTYSKSIPEVLRMAKDGVWGQKVRGEVEYYRNEVPKWQETHQQLSTQLSTLQQQLDAQMALNRELLTAPDDLVIQRREEFANEMSPAQRLARLEAQVAQEREDALHTQRQMERARQADAFVQTRLAPVLSQAETALGGNDFAKRLVAGQIALATTPLLVNGQLPPDAWPKLEQYLRTDFQAWVKETAQFQQSQTTNTEALRKAQSEAQRAVNQTGQLLRPVGNASAPLNAAPSGPPKNVNDAISRIINRPLATQQG